MGGGGEWEKLKKKNNGNSTFVTCGCGAYWLNLLREDITPTNVLKYVMEIKNISAIRMLQDSGWKSAKVMICHSYQEILDGIAN